MHNNKQINIFGGYYNDPRHHQSGDQFRRQIRNDMTVISGFIFLLENFILAFVQVWKILIFYTMRLAQLKKLPAY